MVTERYAINIQTGYMDGFTINIPKKNFDFILNHYETEIAKLRKTAEEAEANDNEYAMPEFLPDEISEDVIEHEQYTETRYYISDYQACIFLKKYECKPGYHFK